MSYSDSATLVHDETFRDRVGFAVLNAATAIMTELPDTTKPAREAKRTSLAWQMITASGTSDVFVYLCAANTTISGEISNIPDSDLDYVVSSVWDSVAGVTYLEANPPAPVVPDPDPAP